jgi:hypothetical protein
MNQQNNREENKQPESLADLKLTTEQAEQAKAGTGTHSSGGGGGAGKAVFQDIHMTIVI